MSAASKSYGSDARSRRRLPGLLHQGRHGRRPETDVGRDSGGEERRSLLPGLVDRPRTAVRKAVAAPPGTYTSVPSSAIANCTAPPGSTRTPSTTGTGSPVTVSLSRSNAAAHNIPPRRKTRCPEGSTRPADPGSSVRRSPVSSTRICSSPASGRGSVEVKSTARPPGRICGYHSRRPSSDLAIASGVPPAAGTRSRPAL